MKKINGYIKNYEEALLVMHAVRLGTLTPTTERLNNDDRVKIESGNIFCFIEDENGMKRWTDGRIWSPSKINGEFLVYQEVPRHLSKNSIKKRKERERALDSDDLNKTGRFKEDTLDRTTLHKKTVCIRHESLNYHIIAYYRPVFVNYSLADLLYFKKLNEALKKYPLILENSYLKKEIEKSDFYSKHGLQNIIMSPLLESDKRSMLEAIAVEVLIALGRGNQKEM